MTSVFPYYTGAQCTTTNIDYWNLQVRPGYWFGLGSSLALQPTLSPLGTNTVAGDAASVVYSGPNTVATIHVKGWLWTDGIGHHEVMTARDVIFWFNLDKAGTAGGSSTASCGYVPHFGTPDQVLHLQATGAGGLNGNTVRVTFAGHMNKTWVLYDQLAQIVPLAKNWDTFNCSSLSWGAVSTAPSNACVKAFNHLASLPINSALWKWADGPYRQSYAGVSGGTPTGNNIQIRNGNYSGPVHANVATTIVYKPFSTTGAEEGYLQQNKLSTGYVDPSHINPPTGGPGTAGTLTLPSTGGYHTLGSVTFGVFYWMFNFDNSHSTYHTAGPLPAWAELNNQQYFRQSMQQSINQAGVIAHTQNGYAVPTYSGIPTLPHNPYGPLYSTPANPFPYQSSNAAAKLRLQQHGWDTSVFPAVCTWQAPAHPFGCGHAGFPVAHGATATLHIFVPSGSPAFTQQVTDEVNTLHNSGIQLIADYDTATNVANGCFGDVAPDNQWQMCGYGGWIFAPDYFPSGEVLFVLGSSSNSGGYGSSQMQCLMKDNTIQGNVGLTQNDPACGAPVTSYGALSADDVPFLWQPTPTGFTVQKNTVHGLPLPSPLGNFNPEYVTSL